MSGNEHAVPKMTPVSGNHDCEVSALLHDHGYHGYLVIGQFKSQSRLNVL